MISKTHKSKSTWQERALPAVFLLGGGVVYGGIVTANKMAIGAGVPFAAYTFWQTCIAGLFLFVLALVFGKIPSISIPHLRHYFLTSFLGIVVPLLVLTYVADQLPAGVLTLIFALAPPLAYVYAFALNRERFEWLSVGGVICGFLGIVMIVVPEGTLPSAAASIWMVFALAVPIVLAANNMVMAYLRPSGTSTLELVCGLQLAAAMISFPFMMFTGGFYPLWIAPTAGLLALAWASATQAITFLAVLEVIRRAGPVYTAQINYVIVISGFLWALVLYDENLTGWVWGALFIMLIGLACAQSGAMRIRQSDDS